MAWNSGSHGPNNPGPFRLNQNAGTALDAQAVNLTGDSSGFEFVYENQPGFVLQRDRDHLTFADTEIRGKKKFRQASEGTTWIQSADWSCDDPARPTQESTTSR
jgi:hypothetical protein